MSQQAIALPRPLRSAPTARPAPRTRAPQRPALAVAAKGQARSRSFVLSCVASVLGIFIAVLILNTVMASDRYQINKLRAEAADLSVTEQSLSNEVVTLSAPQNVAKRATALGMVPASTSGFIRLSDGRITGAPKPAQASAALTLGSAPSASASGSTSKGSAASASKKSSTKGSAKSAAASATKRGATTKSTASGTTKSSASTKAGSKAKSSSSR